VFENRVLRRIFGPKREEVAGPGEDSVTRSFVTCTLHEMLLGRSSQGRIKWAEHVARREERGMHIQFWSENPKGRYHSEYRGVDAKIIFAFILGR
jgi:hypothetical protein